MPKTGQLNRLDSLIYGTLLCLVIEVANAVIVYKLETSDQAQLALIFDWVAFATVIGGYPVLNLALFLGYGPVSSPCFLYCPILFFSNPQPCLSGHCLRTGE